MRWGRPPPALVCLTVGAIVFGLAAVESRIGANRLEQYEHERLELLQTQFEARRALGLLLDLETGQRGYVMTGDTVFLAPYRSGLLQFPLAWERLQQRLADDEPSQPTLHRLRALIPERMRLFAGNVERRQRLGIAALRDTAPYVEGKMITDRIRAELALVEQRQEERIAQSQNETDLVHVRAFWASLVLPLAGGVCVIAGVLVLSQERRARDHAERALRMINTDLEAAVQQRTEALREALDRIQGFASELDRSVEGERRRLAREVHDQVGQVATAIKMTASALRMQATDTGQSQTLDELVALADQAIECARRISSELRPPLLDELGLQAAVQHFAEALRKRAPGLRIEIDIHDDHMLRPEQANQLFRILQEAATNTLRHANARSLLVQGQCEDDRYRLHITDDGRGPGPVRRGAAGLRNIRERAALAGGIAHMGPGPRGGTRVSVMLPCDDAAAVPQEEKETA